MATDSSESGVLVVQANHMEVLSQGYYAFIKDKNDLTTYKDILQL